MMDEMRAELRLAGVDPATLARLTEDGSDDVWTFAVPGPEAVSVWRRIRQSVARTGRWPVMLGSKSDLEAHRGLLEEAEERTPQDVIHQGEAMNVPAWFVEREKNWAGEEPDGGLGGYHGDWPLGDQASHSFYVPANYKLGKESALYFGLFPAHEGWEVPAHLRWGGWNECPFAEEHVGVLKYWHERYGAELVCATHDIIEMQVARPPKTREEALQLATEQFLYCEDIVTQGLETLERLASTLLGGAVWYFWWD